MTAPHKRTLQVSLAACICFVTLHSAAQAYGVPAEVATFIVAFLALAAMAPGIADYFAIKRWLFKESAGQAAILGQLAAAAVAIPLFWALKQSMSAAAYALEPTAIGAARFLRDYGLPLRFFIVLAAMALTKALLLKWYFAVPLTRQTFGILLLSTLLAAVAAAALAALIAYATL